MRFGGKNNCFIFIFLLGPKQYMKQQGGKHFGVVVFCEAFKIQQCSKVSM